MSLQPWNLKDYIELIIIIICGKMFQNMIKQIIMDVCMYTSEQKHM